MLVTKNVVTKEEVIAAVKELAGELGRSPRYPEVIREVNVTRRQIQRMFGGWAGVLEESGCERVRLGGGERYRAKAKPTTEARRHGEGQNSKPKTFETQRKRRKKLTTDQHRYR